MRSDRRSSYEQWSLELAGALANEGEARQAGAGGRGAEGRGAVCVRQRPRRRLRQHLDCQSCHRPWQAFVAGGPAFYALPATLPAPRPRGSESFSFPPEPDRAGDKGGSMVMRSTLHHVGAEHLLRALAAIFRAADQARNHVPLPNRAFARAGFSTGLLRRLGRPTRRHDRSTRAARRRPPPRRHRARPAPGRRDSSPGRGAAPSPAVASAPASAARGRGLRARRVRDSAAAAGTSASSIVRSPGLAPPSSPIAATPAAKARAQSGAAGRGRQASGPRAAGRRVERPGTAADRPAQRLAGRRPAASAGSDQALRRQRAQRRGAAHHADAEVAVAGAAVEIGQRAPRPPPAPRRPRAAPSISRGSAGPHRHGAPARSAGAATTARAAIRPSPARPAPRRRVEQRQPRVVDPQQRQRARPASPARSGKCPHQARSTTSAARPQHGDRAAGDDRELHRRRAAEAVDQQRHPARPARAPRSARIVASRRSTSASAGIIAARSTPGSPWMPRPSSISSSPSSKPGPARRRHGAGAERDAHRAERPPPPRAPRARPRPARSPAAAAAPAILWTSTVPAMPRRRRAATVPRSATSSATMTTSTGMPSARASSAARPKFSRSPV